MKERTGREDHLRLNMFRVVKNANPGMEAEVGVIRGAVSLQGRHPADLHPRVRILRPITQVRLRAVEVKVEVAAVAGEVGRADLADLAGAGNDGR